MGVAESRGECLEVLIDPTLDALEIIATTDLGFRFFAMNNRIAPFDDPAFRQAIAHALPRDTIVANIFKGYAEPADSHVSVAIDYWHNPDLSQYEFDLEKARHPGCSVLGDGVGHQLGVDERVAYAWRQAHVGQGS